jgi:hypothetical protein
MHAIARPESGLDRLDSTLFVLMILSRAARKRRRLRRSSTLDKIINTNNPASKRSRPPSDHFELLIPVAALSPKDAMIV